MMMNYLIYFISLPKDKQVQQIIILLTFFTFVISICFILKFLKTKFLNNNKDSMFQKFLKKL